MTSQEVKMLLLQSTESREIALFRSFIDQLNKANKVKVLGEVFHITVLTLKMLRNII